MEIFLIKAAQLLLCFMLLVLLHEGGHFFFAKLFGIRVKKFCIFFDPGFNIGSRHFTGNVKLFSLHGTDYCLGWLPLGGYVTIAGMVDESTNAEQLEADDTPALDVQRGNDRLVDRRAARGDALVFVEPPVEAAAEADDAQRGQSAHPVQTLDADDLQPFVDRRAEGDRAGRPEPDHRDVVLALERRFGRQAANDRAATLRHATVHL